MNIHHLLFIISCSLQRVPAGILSTEFHLILWIGLNLFNLTIQNAGVSSTLAILSSSIVTGGKEGLLHAWMIDQGGAAFWRRSNVSVLMIEENWATNLNRISNFT